MIRVVVADDHPVPRAGIIQAISQDPNIQVVGEASNGPEVWSVLEQSFPDVLLLDFRMPEFEPLREVPLLLDRYPELKILMVTGHKEEEYVRSMAKAGVYGYLLKDEESSVYIKAIYDVADRREFYSSDVRGVARSREPSRPTLTPQETAVLELAAQGLTSREIGHELGIATRTVNFHMQNVFGKLNISGRAAATAKALELKLIEPWKEE
jgi:DNA-binding NarL/FixJ family response regulator